jgi:hypothetical protein
MVASFHQAPCVARLILGCPEIVHVLADQGDVPPQAVPQPRQDP